MELETHHATTMIHTCGAGHVHVCEGLKTDNFCRICEEEGKPKVPFTFLHLRTAHPKKPEVDLNNIEVKEGLEDDKEVREFLANWDSDDEVDEVDINENGDVQAVYVGTSKDIPVVEHEYLTPITINGVDTLALTDTGANHSLVSEAFAEAHGWEFVPCEGTISRAGLSEPRKGKIMATIQCGQTSAEIWLTVLPNSRHDVILGRRDFPVFGFRLTRLPVKPPGPERKDTEDLVPDLLETEVVQEELDPRIEEALRRNAHIDPMSHCTHPLAELDLDWKSEPTCFKNRNYFKAEDIPDADKVIKE